MEKQSRKKRRVEGSPTPPRVSITVRMEASLFEAMSERIKQYKGSRNEYICDLIDLDTKHGEKFK